jgi:hypothetical protein
MVVLFGSKNKKNDRPPRPEAKGIGYQVFGEKAKSGGRKNQKT